MTSFAGGALIPVAVLSLLEQRSDHGYSLLGRLEESGFSKVKAGSLYPQLRAFEESGWVEHHWKTDGPGPARKVFSITALGKTQRDSWWSEL